MSLPDSEQLEPEVPYDTHRVLFEGVVETCTDEMIQMYVTLVLNPDLDETFKVEEMRRNRQRVMLRLNRPVPFESASERQNKLPRVCGAQVTMHHVRVPDTLRASELANNCTREVLSLYFTNVRASNGGDLKSIKMFTYENKALIQFRNYTKVDEVLSKTHIVCESVIKLERYYGPIEEEYFVEEEEFEQNGNSTPSLAEQLKPANIATLLLETKSEKAKRQSIWAMTSLKSFTTPQATIDKTKLIMANIQENTSIQQIDFLVQLITNKQEINEINWSLEHKGKLLIDFKKEIDINRILFEFSQNLLNNINGVPVQLETVNATRTLVVLVKDVKRNRRNHTHQTAAKLNSALDEDEYTPENIPATRDLLELYFVNKARSGGGEIESIERKSARYWLIVMRDQRAVRDILARKHIVDEKPIRVFPYFDNFGLPYLFKPIFDELSTNISSSVDATTASSASVFKLKIKDDRLRYFCKVKSLHKRLNEILGESNAVSRYNKQESNILYVNYVDRVQTKVPYMERMWRLKVKESIEYFLHIYKYEKLTLSFNQWATICKTKQINESLLNRQLGGVEEFDDASMIDAASVIQSDDKIKLVGNNCAIISVTETDSNVEMSIVGPNAEVDKFIVKIKDIICKAYFTFELEEKIIKFKTYLYECEELLSKWLSQDTSGDLADSDAESVTLPSGASRASADGDSIAYKTLKLNKSRRKTIDEFIGKLERDHLDMELSYGKLFQELGYTFLNSGAGSASAGEAEDDDEDSYEYKDFNDRLASALDESIAAKTDLAESQMDKIKFTLDDLRVRINDMRKKFRQFVIKAKKGKSGGATKKATSSGGGSRPMSEAGDDTYEEVESAEDQNLQRVSVYVKDQAKIITFRVNRKCKLRELKQILAEKVKPDNNDDEEEEEKEEEEAPVPTSMEKMSLSFNNVELINNMLSISDYGINDKATITLTFK